MLDAETDRPAPNEEITSEMMEAGLAHLYRYHADRGVDDEETVRRVFQAMLSARPSSRRESR